MSRSLARVVALVAVGALVTVAGAPAGSPGTWTRLTDPNGRNIDEVGLTRTPDGVLHVFWVREAGGKEGIFHTPISPSGQAGSRAPVLDGFEGVDNPDAVVTGDQRLRVFFMGLGGPAETSGVVSASAALTGGAWAADGRVSSSRSAVGSVGAGVTRAGEPAFAYSITAHLGFHVGLDAESSDQELQPDAKCCDYLPDLATDAAGGATTIAWYSNAQGRRGIWAQQVLPSLGGRVLAPGSLTRARSVGIDQRTPIAARLGAPGVYVAYCSGYPRCTRAMLWRVGAKKALPAGGSPDVEDVNVAAGPEGRLWVMWHDGQSSKTLFVRRTNKAVTRFGPLLRVNPPNGTTSVWKLKGDGSLGALDLLASVSTGKALSTWHTQVRPPLSLSAKRQKSTVTFRVTDAGDPVAGATVTVGGKKLQTNAAGTAKTSLGAAAQATAGKAGYTSASVRVGA
jgi:hypothetical protein